MARDTLTVQTLTANAGTTFTNPAAVTAANGIMVQANDCHKMLFQYLSTVSGTLSVVAGTAANAFEKDLGNTNIVIGGTTWTVFCIDTARHMNVGGSIFISFTSSMAGSLYAFKLPDTV